MTELLMRRHPTLLGEGGLLFRQIDGYVFDFICNEFLKNDEYPNWKEELVGEDSDEFIDNIIHQTINSEDYEDSNMRYFQLPTTYHNAHGLILQYITVAGMYMVGEDYRVDNKCMFDGDRACLSYAYFWLDNNRDWLKNILKDFRWSCMAEDEEEEEVSN